MKKKTLATKIGAALMSAVLAVSMAACGNDGASQGSSSQEDTSLDGSQSESGNQDSGESSGDSGETAEMLRRTHPAVRMPGKERFLETAKTRQGGSCAP